VRYRELLQRVRENGFDQVARQSQNNYDLAIIGKKGALVPFAFDNYPVILERGEDSDVDEEVADALFRWMNRH